MGLNQSPSSAPAHLGQDLPSLAHLENSGVMRVLGGPSLEERQRKNKVSPKGRQDGPERGCWVHPAAGPPFPFSHPSTPCAHTCFRTAPRSASLSLASPGSSPVQGMTSASVYLAMWSRTMDPSLWWAVRVESPGGLPLALAETLTPEVLVWVSDWRCLWLSLLPLACPTSPALSRGAPRILWLPILQSVIPVHIQVSVTVRILFAAAHDEARACGRQGVRARGQQDESKDPPSVP